MTELLPCPKCGSENLERRRAMFPPSFVEVINCKDCLHGGPLVWPDDSGTAKAAWNEAAQKARPRAPTPPFWVDEDGDVVDADGWLICRPAKEVWPDGDKEHARWVCEALNAQAAELLKHKTPPPGR